MAEFKLPELPYGLDDLAPVLSRETLEFHHGKHHQAYITNLNGLIAGTENESKSVEEIIKSAEPGGLFNNSAQAYNHTFYWFGLAPSKGESNAPSGSIADAINTKFGDFETFKSQFSDLGVKHFGSGWAWLVKNISGELEMKGMHDADTPIKTGDTPLLALDVWEHAYYIDYRNKRPDYISAFWQLVNWDFVEQRFVADSYESLMMPS